MDPNTLKEATDKTEDPSSSSQKNENLEDKKAHEALVTNPEGIKESHPTESLSENTGKKRKSSLEAIESSFDTKEHQDSSEPKNLTEENKVESNDVKTPDEIAVEVHKKDNEKTAQETEKSKNDVENVVSQVLEDAVKEVSKPDESTEKLEGKKNYVPESDGPLIKEEISVVESHDEKQDTKETPVIEATPVVEEKKSEPEPCESIVKVNLSEQEIHDEKQIVEKTLETEAKTVVEENKNLEILPVSQTDEPKTTQPTEAQEQKDSIAKIEIKAEDIIEEPPSEVPLEQAALESNEELPPPPQVLFREPSSSDPEAPDSQHSYFQELGSLRLQMNDWTSSQLSTYLYEDTPPLDQEGLNRINKEIKAMTRALPCEPSGAVFVSIDSSNLSRLKALISGTEDTPYEHGLYLFDIKLDGDYPNSPPKMTIKTTGGGTLRFNPNLYDSGYVCLSIINTWGGDPEEMWNPSYSTLLQVFLSIQALVMNNDVIQKEPGYEYMDTHCPENEDYAGIVKYGNMAYAMINMLKNPPEEFKEIIIKHFTLKKEKILSTVEKWVKDSEKMGNGFNDYILSAHNPTAISLLREKSPSVVFKELYDQLVEELAKLTSL
ncbi:hypothetical protein SteCoe_8790 [Stentor coeruleus]|uniref:UBC core domain-containing protein n=1 Tax=Stentor coeruleus TaxID=5963 RepID=A0A1R2CJA0_9CILI|nr:hypothetical protein SteCoe_8790 [Stentor coeruleus]